MAETRQPEIEVGLTGKGTDVRPEWFELKGNKETVDSVLATWAEGGQGPGGRVFSSRLNRTYFRVRTKDGSIYEIAHELPENRKAAARWILVQQLQAGPTTSTPSAKPAAPAATRATPSKAGKTTAARDGASKKPRATAGARPRTSRAKPKTSG